MSITRDTRPVDPEDQSRRERLTDLAKTLRSIHSALLESLKRDYEAAHGKIPGPLKLYQLVIDDPFFSWLRPLSAQMALIDERIDDKTKLEPGDLHTIQDTINGLFNPKKAKVGGFAANYKTRLPSDHNLIVLHGQLLEQLKNFVS